LAVVGVDGAGNFQYDAINPVGYPTGNVQGWARYTPDQKRLEAGMNISSVVWISTGLYDYNFTYPMVDQNYAVSGNGGHGGNIIIASLTTASPAVMPSTTKFRGLSVLGNSSFPAWDWNYFTMMVVR
jgi:hypothetical protein